MAERPEDNSGAQASVFERHAQTAIAMIIVAAIAWVGTQVTGSREAVVRLEVRVEALAQSLDDLRTGNDKAYTRAEADRTHAEIERRISSCEARVSRLEGVR